MSFVLEGVASGSKNNCFWIKQFDVLLDLGICSRNLVGISNILLTHAHSDHCAGLIYYLSQRELFDLRPAKVYVPPPTLNHFQKAIEAWEVLEGIPYQYTLVASEPNIRYPLKSNHYFQCYPVRHRIASSAYIIFEFKHKLKEEYAHLSNTEIQQIRKTCPVSQEISWPLVSYLGDCDFDSFLQIEEFRNSKYLILESTYIDHWHSIEHAKRWGHIHLEQIFADPTLFQKVEKLILTHFSSRYSPTYIQKTVLSLCPDSLKEKLVLWTGIENENTSQLVLT